MSGVYAKPIDHDLENVISYAFKSVEKGRFNFDDAVLVLPKVRSELS